MNRTYFLHQHIIPFLSQNMLPQRSNNLAISTCIAIIKEIENENLVWSTATLINNIRHVGALDTVFFQVLFGSDRGYSFSPKKSLTQIDIDSLVMTISHSLSTTGDIERGVSVDPSNSRRNTTLGHVLSGISAGLFADKLPLDRQKIQLIRGWKFKLGTFPIKIDNVTVDSPINLAFLAQSVSIDSLYAATIAGDVGQTITGDETLYTDQTYPLGSGGIGSEATSAELYGDIDGFLLGAWIRSKNMKSIRDRMNLPMSEKNNVKLSTILGEYYGTIQSKDRTLNMKSVFGTPLLSSLRFSTFVRMLQYRSFRLELLFQCVAFQKSYSAFKLIYQDKYRQTVDAYFKFENWCVSEYGILKNASALSQETGMCFTDCIDDPDVPTWFEVNPWFIAELKDTEQIDKSTYTEIANLENRDWLSDNLFISQQIA